MKDELLGMCEPAHNLTIMCCHFRYYASLCYHEPTDGNDVDISNSLAEKNGLHKTYMDLRTDATKAAFFRCRRLVKQQLREMQDAWMVKKAEEIQGYAKRNEMKNFIKTIKAI
ncbi:unnamed protein product [Schistocephalus solidus]|uniref:Uncharacterized protein n=1 Tax=Schistocephalus solidus TaxID=70667 RepID=A0A183T243_SCHSO|nr:unnamed protein product [Schistocephalus solidus]